MFHWVLSENIIVMSIKSHLELFNISVKHISAQNLGNFDQLVVVVFALEERLFLENHSCEHAAQRPNIQVVVIGLQVDEKLRPLEVPTCHSDIVLLVWMVELRQTPIDQSQFFVVVVDHDIVWLDISVHDTFGVAIVESFQYFINVESNVLVSEGLVQSAEINVTCVDVLHDQSRSLSHRVSNYVHQVDDVDTSPKCLQNFNFSPNLGLFDRLQNFDDNSLIVKRVDAFIDLRVLPSTDLLDDFIVFLGPKGC